MGSCFCKAIIIESDSINTEIQNQPVNKELVDAVDIWFLNQKEDYEI